MMCSFTKLVEVRVTKLWVQPQLFGSHCNLFGIQFDTLTYHNGLHDTICIMNRLHGSFQRISSRMDRLGCDSRSSF